MDQGGMAISLSGRTAGAGGSGTVVLTGVGVNKNQSTFTPCKFRVGSGNSLHVLEDVNIDVGSMNNSSVTPPRTPNVSGMEVEDLEEEIRRCSTESSMFLLLNTRLRCHQALRVGDPKLYTNLIDAAQFIQVLCDNSTVSQDRLRYTGVLGTLVDTFVFIFKSHLEDQVSPLSYGPLMRCWCQICSALWHAVDSPTNKRNQEMVLGKIFSKNDLKIMDFVFKSSQSIEKQTEAYVIPIIQLFKGLIDDNMKTQEMISSCKQFFVYLIESFRARVQMKHMDELMRKSVDLMAWLLSLILQYENNKLVNQSSDNLDGERKAVDRTLCSLIGPCCSFMDTNENEEKPQSVGTILFLASIFSRSLESVHQFNNCKGNDLIVKIHGMDHPQSVKDAMRALMAILKFQNKLIRPEYTHIDHDNDVEERSRSSFSRPSSSFIVPYNMHSDNRDSNAGNSYSPSPSPPGQAQVVLKSNWIELDEDFCTAWVKFATTEGEQMRSRSSMEKYNRQCQSHPSPSIVGSETGSSVSKYRQSSVCGESTFRKGDSNDFQPPPKRKRLANTFTTSEAQKRQRDEEDDSASFSMSIPKVSSQSQPQMREKPTNDILSGSQVAKILADLRPCEIRETDENLVLICESRSQKSDSSTIGNTGKIINRHPKSKSTSKNRAKNFQKSTSIFGTIFNWLWN